MSDGLWTVPPAGEAAETYLTDSVVRDGTRITTNMADDTRYQAMANADTYSPKRRIETPHVELSADVVMPESLTTSIQPHYQVPHALDLTERFRYALRVAGPLLALGVNSPFFPPELYDTDDPRAVLDDQWMENRIPVFEGVFNPEERRDKVRFPADVTTVEQAIDRIATDPPLVPMRVDPDGRFDDAFRHFDHKHGSFWRWVRPVFDGATRSAANARIEFRALPAQPTVRDSLAFVAAFAGLMESLPRREHPVLGLDWEVARENFDAASGRSRRRYPVDNPERRGRHRHRDDYRRTAGVCPRRSRAARPRGVRGRRVPRPASRPPHRGRHPGRVEASGSPPTRRRRRIARVGGPRDADGLRRTAVRDPR